MVVLPRDWFWAIDFILIKINNLVVEVQVTILKSAGDINLAVL